jgi:type III restriction enzyme
MKQLQNELKGKRAGLSTAEAEWAAKFKEARTARDGVLEKLGAHKTVTSQIIRLREEITQLTNQIGDLDAKVKADSDPASVLTKALAELKQINDQRAKRTQEWATEIEKLSSGKIKAVVNIAGDTSEIKDAVDAVASKTGSQEATRLMKLEEAMASDSVRNVLAGISVLTLHLQLLYRSGGLPLQGPASFGPRSFRRRRERPVSRLALTQHREVPFFQSILPTLLPPPQRPHRNRPRSALYLSGCRGQHRDPLQHAAKEPSRQMTLREKQPVVAGVLDQAAAGFHQALL